MAEDFGIKLDDENMLDIKLNDIEDDDYEHDVDELLTRDFRYVPQGTQMSEMMASFGYNNF